MHGGQNVGQLFASREAAPNLLVATERTGARGDEVTHTGQTGEGERIRARSDAQTRDFGKAASDEGGFGVFPISHTIVEARADGNDIFQRATQFHTDYITGRVDAECGAAQYGASATGHILIVGGDDGGGRLFLSYLTRDGGSAEGRDTVMASWQLLLDNFGHTLQSVDLYALAGTDNERFLSNMGSQHMQIFTHAL